jgi:hypothetical protein
MILAGEPGRPRDHVDVLCPPCPEGQIMARGHWDRAEVLAGQAGAPLRRAGIEDSFVTPLACAAQARTALHRADVPAARRQLVMAQRLRPVLT